jgi:ABC-2 type transport system ATP-binding protein
MAAPIITFENISKSFGKKKVIRQLTLSIHPHEIFGIIGRSGAGKSTLLKMLIGFYPVDSGRIFFHGKDITNNASLMKRAVGFCTQENSFYQELTVAENLFYYGKLYGLSTKELKKRQQELLHLVELSSSTRTIAGHLSGGMKRRLDFALSLLHHPDMLVLDEPTTGLDPITETQIWELIKELSKKGVSIIVISHMLSFVEQYCTTVGFLSRGEIILTANPEDLRKRYAHKKTLAEIFAHIISMREYNEH